MTRLIHQERLGCLFFVAALLVFIVLAVAAYPEWAEWSAELNKGN